MFNQEIHTLFEHGFKLENTLDEPQATYMTLYYIQKAFQTRLIILPMLLFLKTLCEDVTML